MNPLYSMMKSNPMSDFSQRLAQLKSTFGGDPQQAVQQMLNSGKITQEQYNAAVRKAQEIQRMMR